MVRGFARRLDRLGIRSPDKTPHALRHTHATAMWEFNALSSTLLFDSWGQTP